MKQKPPTVSAGGEYFKTVTMKGKNKKARARSSRGRGGRPRLEDADRRGHRIGVPVNGEELTLITERAARHHMKNAAFLRHVALGRKLPRAVPAINFRAYRRLGRLSASVSRILCMNREERACPAGGIAQQILDELRLVRRLLVTGEGDEHFDDDGQ